MRKLLYIVLIYGFLTGCSSESVEDNTAPTIPTLSYPLNNQSCTDVILNLEWATSEDNEGDAVSYLIQVAKDAGFTNLFHESTVMGTSKELTFEINEGYYWRVKALDSQNASSNFSNMYRFYSEGEGTENHVPFAAELIAPLEDSFIVSGEVKLEWSAVDLDKDDVLTYDVFIGTSMESLASEVTNSIDTFCNVNAQSGITYYWRVDVKDTKGGIAIGQIWEFTGM